MVRVLALSGSLRRASSNVTLLRAAQKLAPDQVKIDVYAGIASLPHFNPDIESAAGEAVKNLKAEVARADGLIVSSPEYAHGVPGSLKNALDWLVGGSEFAGKPVALFNASNRGVYAQAALREIIKTMAGQLIEDACVTVDLMGKKVGVEDLLKDADSVRLIRSGLEVLARAC